MSDPGKLNLRMSVHEPVATGDCMGGTGVIFTLRRALWAAFEPDAPALASTEPLRDGLARGRLITRLGLAPPAGWQLVWTARGQTRTLEVLALQTGTPADPFDRCQVVEVSTAGAS